MYKLFLLVFFVGFREIPAQEIEFMALGDSVGSSIKVSMVIRQPPTSTQG